MSTSECNLVSWNASWPKPTYVWYVFMASRNVSFKSVKSSCLFCVFWILSAISGAIFLHVSRNKNYDSYSTNVREIYSSLEQSWKWNYKNLQVRSNHLHLRLRLQPWRSLTFPNIVQSSPEVNQIYSVRTLGPFYTSNFRRVECNSNNRQWDSLSNDLLLELHSTRRKFGV